MATAIVVIVLVIIVALAAQNAYSHMKGEGACCGGGGSDEFNEPDKELDGEIVGTKTIKIEGMHCNHCVNSVKRSLNKLDGVSAKVDLANNEAVVSFNREVEDDELKMAVERVDFKVTSIS